MRILFAVLATLLVLASQANAQTAGGVWETTWAGGEAVLDLTQKGTAVTGIYSGTNEGKVKGTIAGSVLTGIWTGTANDSGGFVLKFSADGKRFTGTWGMGTSKTEGGPWTGTPSSCCAAAFNRSSHGWIPRHLQWSGIEMPCCCHVG